MSEELKEATELLLFSFPRSFVNSSNEFIAHLKTNTYICLGNCETEEDVSCKVLEWFSRSAFKTEPFSTKKRNGTFHEFMLNGINSFLDTSFSNEDIDEIYTELGNSINHEKTVKFVRGGMDVRTLKEGSVVLKGE